MACRPIANLLILAILAVAVLAPCRAFAAEAQSDVPLGQSGRIADSDHPPEFEIPWVRLVSGTAVVLALACFGAYGLKRLESRGRSGRCIEVLDSRSLGRKTQVFVLKVAGRVIVLAGSGENVTLLAELDESELPAPEAAEGAPAALDFGGLVKRLAGVSK